MRAASPDRDRWLALGILGALLLVAYFVLVHPWWTVPMLDINDRIADLQDRIGAAEQGAHQRRSGEDRRHQRRLDP